MFRKLVSSVPFSPALVGQLGFYARRLKKEEATRRLGLIFTALALVVQSFVVFSPPESANAASSNDMVYGGISSVNDYLRAYDTDARIRNVMKMAGISRTDISRSQERLLNNLSNGTDSDAWRSYGWNSKFSTAQGEIRHNASGTIVYSRPHHLYNTTTYQKSNGQNIRVLYGKSTLTGKAFALQFACGNLWTPGTPSLPPPPPPPPPAPVAACKSIAVARIDDKQRKFTATASASNGATISSYTFNVTNTEGKTIKSLSYPSTSSALTTPAVSFEPGSYNVKATVTTSLGNITSANCATPFSIASPGISIDKTVNDKEQASVDINEEFTYQVTVKNTGGTTLTNVQVTDPAPDSISFISASAGTITNNTWKTTIDQLAPNASQSFAIKAKATKAAEPGTTILKNTACVETGSIDATNPDDCDDALVEVPEVTMQVCDLSTDKVITIKKSEFSNSRHSTNLKDCVQIQVCDKATDTITTIREPAFDAEKHTKNLDECDKIQVCELESGDVITIALNDFDDNKHSEDASDCVPDIAESKSAINMTQDSEDATTTLAQANDRIRYTITSTNVGSVEATADFVENLGDVLEYATIIDTGGGTFDKDTKVLTWQSTVLKPGEKQSRMFTVQLASTIPAGARGVSNPASYDCTLLNTYGNSVEIDVSCPVAKQVESAVTQLPKTGPTANLLFAGGLLAVVTYFYARSRQLNTEIRLIRRDLNSTGI